MAHNLKGYVNLNTMQNAFASLLSGLYIQQSEIDELDNIWKKLDMNGDNRMTQREMFKGFKTLELHAMGADGDVDDEFSGRQDEEMLLKNQLY